MLRLPVLHALSCLEGAQLLEAETYGAKMQLWNKTTFLLYYFVLTCEESYINPTDTPHFKQVECYKTPNV